MVTAQKQKKAAFNEENGLFDIWLPLVHSFQNISKTIKETILVAETNINSGFFATISQPFHFFLLDSSQRKKCIWVL